jgi:hypothetical protein
VSLKSRGGCLWQLVFPQSPQPSGCLSYPSIVAAHANSKMSDACGQLFACWEGEISRIIECVGFQCLLFVFLTVVSLTFLRLSGCKVDEDQERIMNVSAGSGTATKLL